MVRHSVLQSQPRLHQDIDTPPLPTHLHLQLDQEGDPNRVGTCHPYWPMAGPVCGDSVRPPCGVLGLVLILEDARLLPPGQYMVGERGAAYRE